MFFGQGIFKEFGIQPSFLLTTEHNADILYAAVKELLEQHEDYRLDKAVSVDNRKKILFQEAGSGIKPCAESRYWYHSFTYCVAGLDCKGERSHAE